MSEKNETKGGVAEGYTYSTAGAMQRLAEIEEERDQLLAQLRVGRAELQKQLEVLEEKLGPVVPPEPVKKRRKRGPGRKALGTLLGTRAGEPGDVQP